jgi:hypothetical protein
VTGSDEEFLSLPLLRSIPEAERRQGTGRVGRRPSSSVRTRAFSSSQACHGGIAAKWQRRSRKERTDAADVDGVSLPRRCLSGRRRLMGADDQTTTPAQHDVDQLGSRRDRIPWCGVAGGGGPGGAFVRWGHLRICSASPGLGASACSHRPRRQGLAQPARWRSLPAGCSTLAIDAMRRDDRKPEGLTRG